MRKIWGASILFCSVLLSQANSITPIASAAGIEEYRLQNGLRVLLVEDHTRGSFTLNMTYLAGSSSDLRLKSGAAHLLEHLTFNTVIDNESIKSGLAKRGAAFNGTTTFDRTTYYETLVSSENNLDWALRMESMRMTGLVVDESAVANELRVIDREYALVVNNDFQKLYRDLRNFAFLNSSKAHIPIGKLNELQKLKSQDVMEFYSRNYRPDNAVLILTGNFDKSTALARISEYFDDIVLTDQPKKFPSPYIGLSGMKEIQIESSENRTEYLLAYRIPNVTHKDFPAFIVLNSLLSGDRFGFVYDSLTSRTDLKSFGTRLEYGKHSSLLLFSAQSDRFTSPAKFNEIHIFVSSALPKLIDEEALEYAKQRLLKDAERVRNDSEALNHQLSFYSSFGGWQIFFKLQEDIRKVTLQDIANGLLKYAVMDNAVAGLIGPKHQIISSQSQAPAARSRLIAEIRDHDITNYLRQINISSFSSPQFIPRQNASVYIPGTSAKSSSKLVDTAVQRDLAKGDTVELRIQLNLAETSLIIPALEGLANDVILTASETHPYPQLLKRLQLLDSEIKISGIKRTKTIMITTNKKHLREVLTLLSDLLCKPKLSEVEFDKVKAFHIESLRSIGDNYISAAQVALARILSNSDISTNVANYVPTTSENLGAIESMTLPHFYRYYTDRLKISRVYASAVGDIEPDELRANLEFLFHPKTESGDSANLSVQTGQRPGSRVDLSFPKSENIVVMAAKSLPIGMRSKDYPHVLIASYILFNSSNSRLYKLLRTNKAIAYSVSGGYPADDTTEESSLYLSVVASPGSQDLIIQYTKQLLGEAIREGITEAEVAEAKKAAIAGLDHSVNGQDPLVDVILRELIKGKTYDLQDVKQGILSSSVEDVNDAIQRYISSDGFHYVSSGRL